MLLCRLWHRVLGLLKPCMLQLCAWNYTGCVVSLSSVTAGHSPCPILTSRSLLVQLRDTPTGLKASDNSDITYGMAVAGIAKLRDMLGGTSGASVENAITRTPTAYTPNVGSTGPNLFAVNSAGVSFVRSPYQVRITCLQLLLVSALLMMFMFWLTVVQVLDIVYFSNTTTPGGFFPNGVTGMYPPTMAPCPRLLLPSL